MKESDIEGAGRILRQAHGGASLVCTTGLCLKKCKNRGKKCKGCISFSNFVPIVKK